MLPSSPVTIPAISAERMNERVFILNLLTADRQRLIYSKNFVIMQQADCSVCLLSG